MKLTSYLLKAIGWIQLVFYIYGAEHSTTGWADVWAVMAWLMIACLACLTICENHIEST